MGLDKRSPERLRHHYEVEKELGDRMRASTREERTELFSRLYDELFERVPDHPRLVRRETPEESRRGVDARLAILRDHIGADTTFLEFAPGDCRLAYEVCGRVKHVLGVDISDQRAEGEAVPENFELVVYDGYHLEVDPGSVDVAFSYQFLEHLHPDDVPLHMSMAFEALKPGGCYIFDTPHAYSGPHDISSHFSATPQGFHLKEWTYREMFRHAEGGRIQPLLHLPQPQGADELEFQFFDIGTRASRRSLAEKTVDGGAPGVCSSE